MIFSLHGIASSSGLSTEPSAPFNLFFDRDISSPPAYDYLVAAGTWSLNNGSITYDELGKIFFSIDATGDTSSVVEWGIVSSTNSGPTYSSDPLAVNLGNGVVYNVTDETRYFRAYALTNTGQYFYSSSPGVQIPMERFQFTSLDIFTFFGPFGNSSDVDIRCSLFNHNGRMPESYGILANLRSGNVAFTPEEDDPYFLGPDYFDYLSGGIVSEFSDGSFNRIYYGVPDGFNMYVRAFIIIGGYRYWSGLLQISL